MAWNRMGLHLLEAFLVARLLRSQAFHRLVQKVYRKINRIPHHEEDFAHMGGTRTDGPDNGFKRFVKLYIEEFKKEFRRK